jgi:hypothetical protein
MVGELKNKYMNFNIQLCELNVYTDSRYIRFWLDIGNIEMKGSLFYFEYENFLEYIENDQNEDRITLQLQLFYFPLMYFRKTVKTSIWKRIKDFLLEDKVCLWLSNKREDFCEHPALQKDTNQEICSKCSSFCSSNDFVHLTTLII